jgi:two-component system LytT family sensor kinase
MILDSFFMKIRYTHFNIALLLIFIGVTGYGQETVLDTIITKAQEFTKTFSSKEKSILTDQIMDLNYGLSIEDANTLRKELNELASQESNPGYNIISCMILGDVFYFKNQMDSSFYYYLKQAQLAENNQVLNFAISGYVNAAYVLEVEGKLFEAIELIKRADRLPYEPEDEVFMGSGFFNLALIYHKMGQPDSASYYLKKVIEIDRANENLSGMVHNLQFLVDLELRSGKLEDAKIYCEECLALSKQANYKRGEGMCLYSIAFTAYQAGDYPDALKYINESIGIDIERKDSTKMGQLLRLKANITSKSDQNAAEMLYREAVEYGKASKNVLQLCNTGIDLAKFYLGEKKYSKAKGVIDDVKEWVKGKDLIDIEEKLLDLQYDLAKKQGNLFLANQILEQKGEFKEKRIKDLFNSQSNSANQYYEMFEMERELQEVSHQNEINQLEAKRMNNIYMSVGGILLLTSLLGYFAFQNQKNRNLVLQKTSEEEKLIANNRILEKELDALRSQMNPHFLFNSLNSINDYIMHQEPRIASKYLTKFSKLMRTILNNSKKKFVTIQEELDAINLYMEMEQLRFSGKFDYELNIDSGIDKNALMIPAMLIQPYLENSVKHGIKHLTERKGLINVNIYQLENDRIKIQIIDNGVGRKKSQEIKHSLDRNRKSYGIEITSDRVHILNQIYEVDADLKYIDHENPSGTEVVLSLTPIKNETPTWKESGQLL